MNQSSKKENIAKQLPELEASSLFEAISHKRRIKLLKELVRFIIAHVTSLVLSNPQAITNKDLVNSINLDQFIFDPEFIRKRYSQLSEQSDSYEWKFDLQLLKPFWKFRLGKDKANEA